MIEYKHFILPTFLFLGDIVVVRKLCSLFNSLLFYIPMDDLSIGRIKEFLAENGVILDSIKHMKVTIFVVSYELEVELVYMGQFYQIVSELRSHPRIDGGIVTTTKIFSDGRFLTDCVSEHLI